MDGMDPDDDTPEDEFEEIAASTDVHEVLRYTRGDETRTYSLRVVPGGAELWRVTESPDAAPDAVKESDFRSQQEVSAFLEEVRRALKAGGWRDA